MFNNRSRTIAVAGFAALGLVGLSACSSDGGSTAASTTTASSAAMSTTSSAASSSSAADAQLVGAGCAQYAAANPTGAGSVSGMAQDPVAVAASNNPMLTTLTAAVSGQVNPDVNLVDTLNSGEFTVFAPIDSAFAKIDPATIATLSTDSALLTKILTYHVVPGQISPADIDGTHVTAEGGSVTVTGSGDNIMVDDATVVCGGVKTANATVYLIDTVLMPK